MTEVRHRTVAANGINIHIAEQGSGPLVLLLHGFPELWYSWRHQLPALAAAGFHGVAPDVRGYGQTDAPYPIEAYSMREMTADAVGVLDAIGVEQAVVVGHDWGAPMAWHCALLYPERFPAVIALSVPFAPRSSAMPPTQAFKRIFGDNFFYILYFQEPGVAEAELEEDVRRSMLLSLSNLSGGARSSEALTPRRRASTMFGDRMPPSSLPEWLSQEDLDCYVREFQRTGFRGGLNRYRNMDRDWAELAELQGAKVQQPALFIAGEQDPVLSFTRLESMTPYVPHLKTVLLPGCGHWTQQERPSEVNREIVEFLHGLPIWSQ